MVPYSFYRKGAILACGLKKEEFDLLKKCDGKTDIEDSKLLNELLKSGLIRKCEKNESLTKWQEYRNCNNRYMPKMNLQITGRCNYNCIHCFNAKDNEPLQSELSLTEICKLLDECEECGVQSFTITGGEPMIHPQYKKIIEEIYKRDLYVFELNTNGFFINQEMLDWMKKINYRPLIKISYDGLGFHNWMRGYDKAEDRTLSAIKLCISNGFKVKVQMNINKKNESSILNSLIMLDHLGVEETRIIKTTNAPRWLKNAGNQSMSIEEYYDFSINLLKDYLKESHSMSLTAWLLYYIDPKEKHYKLFPFECGENQYRSSIPLCRGARGMVAVGSDGEVFPCLQSQGYFVEHDIHLGNIKKEGLQKILNEGPYIELVTKTLKDRLESESECKNCSYFKYCCGGCPAMAILTSGNYLLEDKSRCIFFKQGYYEKIKEVIPVSFKETDHVSD